MDLTLEACLGMSPVEVVPIVFQEQIASGRVNIRDFASIGYITGLMKYCLPTVTKQNSTTLVKLLRLEHEIHPHFFYFVQQAYDEGVEKDLKKFTKMIAAQLDKEEREKEALKKVFTLPKG